MTLQKSQPRKHPVSTGAGVSERCGATIARRGAGLRDARLYAPMSAHPALRSAWGIKYTCALRAVTGATIGHTLKRARQVVPAARGENVTDIIPDVRTVNARIGTK